LKYIWTVVICFISLDSFAQNFSFDEYLDVLQDGLGLTEEVHEGENCPCTEDTSLGISSARSQTLPVGDRLFNSRCRNFIRSNGSYGPWGQHIVDYLNDNPRKGNAFFAGGMRGMVTSPGICPNWPNLSAAHKTKFWVWTMASIAHVESSCDQNSVNRGRVPNPSDRPRGLLQLNSLRRERRWRGRNCRFPTNGTDPEDQLSCGMDIMYELIRIPVGLYGGTSRIYPNNSYWEKLRPSHSRTGGDIGRLMRMYEPCGAN
jgi:hypothetical protein